MNFHIEMSVNTSNIFFSKSTHLFNKTLVSFTEQSVLVVSGINSLLCASSSEKKKTNKTKFHSVTDLQYS